MLPKYQKILVPTDFSPNSQFAFRHAVMLARFNDAEIIMLHVLPQVDTTMKNYLATYMGEDMYVEFEKNKLKEHQRELEKDLHDFVATELANFPEDQQRFTDAMIVIGDPVRKILETAEQKNIDVIVMGTHGRGGLEHAFIGSVAERVLRKSKCPVVAVPLK